MRPWRASAGPWRAGEPSCVYGDYDVDGVTATALLVRVLERLGAKVSLLHPQPLHRRLRPAPGLHPGAEGDPRSRPAHLRGLRRAQRGRRWPPAAELGLDWVITDHHALGAGAARRPAPWSTPTWTATPNPHLAGVGVAFKLAQALLGRRAHPAGADAAFLDGLLKLVAIGTVADMVPLVGENALLVRRGLEALGGSQRSRAGRPCCAPPGRRARPAARTSPSAWRPGSMPWAAWAAPKTRSACC